MPEEVVAIIVAIPVLADNLNVVKTRDGSLIRSTTYCYSSYKRGLRTGELSGARACLGRRQTVTPRLHSTTEHGSMFL